jgi:hypothetical protein
MAFIDAQGCTFSFDGELVGKIRAFQVNDGVTPDIAHKPIKANDTTFYPGQADWGSITLRLYRDFVDAGQNAMELARETRKKVTCILTLSDGTTRTFLGYVKRLPIVGDSNGLGTADAVIKVAGRPT